MVSRGFTSREFASRSPFAIKSPNPVCMCAAFFSSRLSNLCRSYLFIPLCSKLSFCKVDFFFYLSALQIHYAYTTAFSITFLTHFKKDGHTLLSSKVFTFDHLFTYIIKTLVNSLTMSLTEWPENQKNRCLSFSANSVGLHFRDRVEKIEENGKKRKQKTYKMGRKNMAGKNSRTFTFGAKLQKHYNFFKFQFEIALNVYLDKFLT